MVAKTLLLKLSIVPQRSMIEQKTLSLSSGTVKFAQSKPLSVMLSMSISIRERSIVELCKVGRTRILSRDKSCQVQPFMMDPGSMT